jgi:uncharacterized protein YoxC
MGDSKVIAEIIGIFGVMAAIAGFIMTWVKIGSDKGRSDKALEALQSKVEKNEKDIAELRRDHNGLQVNLGSFMGEIRAKLDYIKETVDAFRRL